MAERPDETQVPDEEGRDEVEARREGPPGYDLPEEDLYRDEGETDRPEELGGA